MENTLPPDSSVNRQSRASRPRALSSRNAKPGRIRNKLICIAVLFGFSALIMAIGLKTTTSVLYKGELVGVVETKEVAADAVNKAEIKASEILGEKYSITSSITYRRGVTATNLSSDELTTAILEKIDNIQKLNVLFVDGKLIGGTENRKDIQDMLVNILEKSLSATAMSAKFSENTQIAQIFVAKGSIPDLSEMNKQLTTPKEDGTYILNVETVEEVEYKSPVSFSTEYVKDDTLLEGQSTTLTPGKLGEAIVTEKQVLLDGNKVSSEIKDTKILSNPSPAVVAVGTMPRYKSKGTYVWPVRGPITSDFGYRNIGMGGPFHFGIDIATSLGTSICASDGGTVVFAGWYSDYGNMIEIQHDNGDLTRYAHNSKLVVNVGDKVAQGDVIAKAGMTGLADGVHCHFELVRKGVRVDPKAFLS